MEGKEAPKNLEVLGGDGVVLGQVVNLAEPVGDEGPRLEEINGEVGLEEVIPQEVINEPGDLQEANQVPEEVNAVDEPLNLAIPRENRGFQNNGNAPRAAVVPGMEVAPPVGHPLSLWSSEFQNFGVLVRQTAGTLLTNSDRAQAFLNEMQGMEDSPFPDGTLIYTPVPHIRPPGHRLSQQQSNELVKFYNLFTVIVGKYGKHIRRLIYCFQESEKIDYMQLFGELCCLYNLTNLESLAVYRPEMRLTVEVYDFVDEEFLGSLCNYMLPTAIFPVIKELLIFGRYEDDMQFGVPAVIRSLCGSSMLTCEKLQLPLSDGFAISANRNFLNQRLIEMPNLRKLKLMGKLLRGHEMQVFTSGLIPVEANDLAIKVHFSQDQDVFHPLVVHNLFDSVQRLHLNNLTNFRFMINGGQLYPPRARFIEDIDGIRFPETTHLKVGTNSFQRWVNFLDFCNVKFPNLRILTLDIEGRILRARDECQIFCMGLYAGLGPDLELIRVPFHGSGFTRAGDVVVLVDE